MGFNIQSDEFWEMRPDNFTIMSKAYDIRQQQTWLPFRRLMAVIVASQGGEVEEEDFIALPSFDKKKEKVKPIILTPEQKKALEDEFIRTNGYTTA